eukprot:6759747-Lingulodinium_polyedra.AAC.1
MPPRAPRPAGDGSPGTCPPYPTGPDLDTGRDPGSGAAYSPWGAGPREEWPGTPALARNGKRGTRGPLRR